MTFRLCGDRERYLDGFLEPEDRQRFEQHLAECPRCARTVQIVRQLEEQLAALRRGKEVTTD